MRIVFASNLTSKKKYTEIFESRKKKIITPSQKFFELLINGLAYDDCVNVTCVSARPVSKSTSDKVFWRSEKEKYGKIDYYYLPFINGRFIRYICLLICSFFYGVNLFRKCDRSNTVYMSDCLIWPVSIPMRLAASFYGIKTVAFITDLPIYANVKYKRKNLRSLIEQFISSRLMNDLSKYDSYISVSKETILYLNAQNKPWIVIEGSVDFEYVKAYKYESNQIVSTGKSKRTFLYAGGVYEQYGLKNLVEGFIKAHIPNIELHIYGDGDYADYLKDNNPNKEIVKCFGCVSTDEILKKEKEAYVLVNPRPVGDAYNKYSFPSKTSEYMSTGRPVLTTKLPGIPEEYYNYLFFFPGDSIESISEGIISLCSEDRETLDEKGRQGQKFVFEERNNVIQGKRMLSFFNELLGE